MNSEEFLVGKTIKLVEWIGDEEGYGDLQLTFTDNSSIKICYSCMGGVFIHTLEVGKKKGKKK